MFYTNIIYVEVGNFGVFYGFSNYQCSKNLIFNINEINDKYERDSIGGLMASLRLYNTLSGGLVGCDGA